MDALPDLEGTGKSKHVFVCFSKTDSHFVRNEVINPLKEENFITCDFEEDFIPGFSIFENITTAIRESMKYIMIISNNFKRSSWCNYESQLTLSLSIDMRASNVVIPLLIEEHVTVPDFLSIFTAIEITDTEWFQKLCQALKSPIKLLTVNYYPSPLRNKTYHFISIAHLNTIDNTGVMSEKIKKLKDLKQRFFNFLDVRVKAGNFTDCSLVLDGKKFDFKAKQFIKIAVENVKKSSKILLWLSNDYESDKICQGLRKMICLMAEDMCRQNSPWIIPIYLENDFQIPDFEPTCMFTGNGDWYRRLLETICRTDIFYRCKQQTLKFREGEEIFRVAEFEGFMTDDDNSPRFLGITFVEDGLILLDADNNRIKKCTLFGKILRSISLEKRPNRISRVDDTQVAIIFENDKEIMFVETNTFETKLIKPTLRKDELIKGISAQSSSVIFVATNGGKDRPRILKINVDKVKIETTDDLVNDSFEMPRRMTTTPNKSKIVIADENDRRLILMERNGKVVETQKKWNKRLYNVRGLAASNDTIFIAACNGITTADINTLKVAENPLVKFPSNVHHTRAVALDPGGKFLAISQAISDNNEIKEIVRIFFITSPLDMSSEVEHELVYEQQNSSNSVIQFLLNLYDYIE